MPTERTQRTADTAKGLQRANRRQTVHQRQDRHAIREGQVRRSVQRSDSECFVDGLREQGMVRQKGGAAGGRA